MQNFPGIVTNTRIPNCIWGKPNLLVITSQFASPHLSFLRFFPMCNIFPMIGPDRSWYSDESVRRLHFYSLFWAAWILFYFYLKKKTKFFSQSGALLKMPPLFFSWRNLVNNKIALKKCRFQPGNFKYNKSKKQKLKQKLLNLQFLGFTAIQFSTDIKFS